MTNDVKEQTEETNTGASSVEASQDKADAAAAAPVNAASEPKAPPAYESAASGEFDFGAILEQFEQEQTVYHVGELVEGKVVGVSENGVLVDFGYKSEGVIPPDEFEQPIEESVAMGDTIEAVIKSIGGDVPPTLSKNDALGRKVWTDLEEAYKNDAAVRGMITGKIKGGLKVDLDGIEAFLPGSQVDSRPVGNLDPYVGTEIEAKIIKFSRRRNNIVLSRKVITDQEIDALKADTLEKIDLGHIVEGTVKNLTEYGAFVDIGGIDGLLHVTDMSWGRLHHPGDMFKVGDHVQAKVLKLDRDKEKVSLGYKQLLPDPWSTVIEMYPVNSQIKGKVSSVTDYGVFVELEPGVEGLVHVSEISWSKRSASPKRQFNKGEEVEVQVLGVDTEDKRISLGMKQLQDNPWDTIGARYPVGTKIRGKVRNITDFGAFVEIEDGIDGLVHVSDITWAKKVKHPKELLKKDQEVEAIITNIDSRGQRLSLSMKDLTPSAWESFVATHRPGDVVRGKVSRFTSFGVFVELGEGLEGLCHISELSDERVERPEDVVALGQEADFRILRIENVDQKIGLSYRAVGKEDEPIVDSRIYSSEAKGGMASLGELAKLMGKDDAAEEPEMTKEEKDEAKRLRKEQARKEYEETAAREAAAAEDAAKAEAEAADESAKTEAEAPAETSEAADESAKTEAEALAETSEAAAEADEAAAEASDATAETSEATAETTETTEAKAAEATAETTETAEATPEAETASQEATEPPTEAADEAASAEEPLPGTDPEKDAVSDPVAETSEAPAAEEAPAEESEKRSA
ncbi:MAG TPA: 30S ribosomal protein S1 [Pyrinomonadaceae bacterium]